MASRHFGKLADVWKHLVLAEVLSVDRPRQLCDTHAGHACYMMTSDAERRYGVLGFMEAAIDDDVLSRSAYFRLLVRQRNNGTELSDYPAGPLLAMLELGSGSKYLFCDLDPESCANIREVAARLGLEAMVRVVEDDGMTAVRQALPGGNRAGGTLVSTDPFDHQAVAPGGLSALGLAQAAAEGGAAVVYWYGYNRADQRRWIFDLLRGSAPTIGWWCGDLMVSAADADMHNGDLGAATSPGTGFGLVCANVSSDGIQRCGDLGRALSDAYEGRALPDGRAGSLDLLTAGGPSPERRM
jgi:23S rRNA (adenine2030-N6)-methyltransferase